MFLLLFWLADVALTVQHESAHRQICRNFGGENVTTYTNYSFGFTSGETFCSNITSGRGLELHIQNEIMGYHAEGAGLRDLSGCLCSSVLLGDKKIEKLEIPPIKSFSNGLVSSSLQRTQELSPSPGSRVPSSPPSLLLRNHLPVYNGPDRLVCFRRRKLLSHRQ